MALPSAPMTIAQATAINAFRKPFAPADAEFAQLPNPTKSTHPLPVYAGPASEPTLSGSCRRRGRPRPGSR